MIFDEQTKIAVHFVNISCFLMHCRDTTIIVSLEEWMCPQGGLMDCHITI